MATVPLKLNNEIQQRMEINIIQEVADKNWLSVLGDNALKILVLFSSQYNRGEALLGDYNFISEKIGKARGSIASGMTELEAFGFLLVKRIINKKTKSYKINDDICRLSQRWVDFLSNAEYKKLTINLLIGKEVDNKLIEKMQNIAVNSGNEDIEKTLGRLLYLFVERAGFTIEDLLEEERTRMQEDLFPNGFGFGMGDSSTNNWQDVLTDEEKKDKELMKVLTHYVSMVDYPTRKDVELMKKALVYCYAYQIKNSITSAKTHPRYGESFKSFQYIYNQTINGMFGTRKNNKAKEKFENTKVKKPSYRTNNQTDMGFKRSGISRTELIERLNEASMEINTTDLSNSTCIEDEAFDFSKLRG